MSTDEQVALQLAVEHAPPGWPIDVQLQNADRYLEWLRRQRR